jgi:hypothetical protein
MTNEEIINYLREEIPRLERALVRLEGEYTGPDNNMMGRLMMRTKLDLAVCRLALKALALS